MNSKGFQHRQFLVCAATVKQAISVNANGEHSVVWLFFWADKAVPAVAIKLVSLFLFNVIKPKDWSMLFN